MLKNFKETNTEKKAQMLKELDNLKLQNAQSLWYLITSIGKKTIVGSKG